MSVTQEKPAAAPVDTTLPLPPGSLGLPVFGETLQFIFDKKFRAKRIAKYGQIYKSNVLGSPTILMSGPEAAKFVLSTGFDKFSWGEGWPQNFKDMLGRSLFVQDGDEHKRNRKLLAPAFHGKALAGYVQSIEEIVARYLRQWEEKGEFAWFAEHKQLTFEIASVIFLGTNPGADTARLSRLFADLTGGLLGVVRLPGTRTAYGRGLRARAELLEYIQGAVAERKRNPGLDAISLLTQARDEDGKGFSDEELAAQAMLLLFAGHETTTSMMTSLCYELVQHPEILARARAEQRELGITDPVTFEQANKMRYLDQVLREVERMHPPVQGGFRGVVEGFEYNGYYIPKGWRVLYGITSSHEQAAYTAREKFDPDRFAPNREEHKKQAFSLIGFGGGPRVCLGMAFAQMEIKIIASHLLRKYEWELVPGQSLEWRAVPTLYPKDGLRVRFRRLES
jgi:retinoid hydroxylase